MSDDITIVPGDLTDRDRVALGQLLRFGRATTRGWGQTWWWCNGHVIGATTIRRLRARRLLEVTQDEARLTDAGQRVAHRLGLVTQPTPAPGDIVPRSIVSPDPAPDEAEPWDPPDYRDDAGLPVPVDRVLGDDK